MNRTFEDQSQRYRHARQRDSCPLSDDSLDEHISKAVKGAHVDSLPDPGRNRVLWFGVRAALILLPIAVVFFIILPSTSDDNAPVQARQAVIPVPPQSPAVVIPTTPPESVAQQHSVAPSRPVASQQPSPPSQPTASLLPDTLVLLQSDTLAPSFPPSNEALFASLICSSEICDTQRYLFQIRYDLNMI